MPAFNREEQTQLEELFERQSNITRVSEGNRPIQLSVENQRTNNSWGGPMNEKSDHITRVDSLDVNGFALDRRGGQFDERIVPSCVRSPSR
jgi:squalene cyclase